MIHPVILSGGSGSRLWPLSRKKSPKQFIDLVGDNNLLQDTCQRLGSIKDTESTIIVCNEDHRFQVAESLRKLNISNGEIILEPLAKNTAPAIALAALHIFEKDKDGLMLVLAADHHIKHTEPLAKGIQAGQEFAESGSIVTFGICPTQPHTGYGYIHQGPEIKEGVFSVLEFVEKPSEVIAKKYLSSGNYHWNSGMFMMSARTYLKNLEDFDRNTYQACKAAYSKKRKDLDFIRVDEDSFAKATAESVDYAVLEKSKDVVVVPLNHSGWSDVGSWGALFELEERDAQDNIVHGDVFSYDVQNCYLRSHDRLLAAVGIQDLIVVETADAVLVSHKDKTQEVKKIVEQLAEKNRKELIEHKRIYAPWGYRELLVDGDRFIVQKLYFACDKESSIQMHYHRTKHLTVLSGTAEIMLDDKLVFLPENKSIMIDAGVKHQIRNKGKLPLRLMEVQSGSYLKEDDIVRFEK